MDYDLEQALKELSREVHEVKQTHDLLWEDLKKAHVEIGELYREKFNLLMYWAATSVVLGAIALFT